MLLLVVLITACSTTEPPMKVFEPSPAPTAALTAPSPTRASVEAAPLGVGGPDGLPASRVAAYGTTTAAIFGSAVYIGSDGKNWGRSDVPFKDGEIPLAVGVDPLSRARLVGTSMGRILRLDSWYGTPWREVFAAPAGTFQPAVQSFSFRDHFTYASLNGLLASEDDLPWTDLTPGLGGLPDRIEARGRFGTGPAVALADRVLVHIGGVMPDSTGLWSRGTDGRWTKIAFPGPGLRGMTAIGDSVVTVSQPALDLSGRPLVGSWLSPDRGATWRALADPEPAGLLDVVPTPLGFIALGPTALYWLGPNDRWERLTPVQGGGSLAANGREIFVAAQQGVLGFRIQPSAPPLTERCGYELRGPSGGAVNAAARDCLLRAFAAGRPAQLIATRYTQEGDPITDTITVLGHGSILVLTDDRDGFGRPGFYTSSCTTLGPVPRTGTGIEITGCTGGRSGVSLP